MTTQKILLSFAIFVLLLSSANNCLAQKVAFISSDMIRQYYPEAIQADRRVQSMVDEWEREIEQRKLEIDALEFEISKNRLIWTNTEKIEKEKKLQEMILQREQFTQSKYSENGDYDKLTKSLVGVTEVKIRAAVHDVAVDFGFDIIIDQSLTPLPYTNYKYDMTINVLRKLGVDTKTLEAELKEKISKDPRNEQKKTKTPRKGRRTDSSADPKQDDREFNQDTKPIEMNGPPPPMEVPKEETKSNETKQEQK